MTTVLFDNASLYGRDPEWLLTHSLAHFGEVAQTLANGETLKLPEVLRDEPLIAWRDAIAEELLLLAQDHPASANCLATQGFDQRAPFRHGPLLSALLPLRAAVAVIPLDTGHQDRPGTWLHLWLVRDPDNSLGNDHSDRLEGAREWLRQPQQTGIKLFVVTTPDVQNRISGPSWQLGASLARRALDMPQHVAELAESWLITGAVDFRSTEQKTVPVVPGNKTSLAWRETRRSWLLPALNARTPEDRPADFGLDFVRAAYGRLQVAATEEAAWRHITGEGTVDSYETHRWPCDLDVFHGLVSGSLGPFLASILATQPKHLILWCSNEMKEHGRTLLATLVECKKKNWLRSSLDLDETNVTRYAPLRTDLFETELIKESTFNSHTTRKVYFNATGGTFLMRLAVANLAAARPHVRLLYRDANDRGRNFTLFHYPDGRPVTGRAQIPERIHGANLAELLSVWPEKGETSVDLGNRLLVAAGKPVSSNPLFTI